MSEAKKIKYLTKTIKFGTKSLTLYSIDGTTWSSRRAELTVIKERQEAQRVTLGDIKEDDDTAKKEGGEAGEKEAAPGATDAPADAHDDIEAPIIADDEVVIEDDEDDDAELEDLPIEEDDEVSPIAESDDADAEPKKVRGKPHLGKAAPAPKLKQVAREKSAPKLADKKNTGKKMLPRTAAKRKSESGASAKKKKKAA